MERSILVSINRSVLGNQLWVDLELMNSKLPRIFSLTWAYELTFLDILQTKSNTYKLVHSIPIHYQSVKMTFQADVVWLIACIWLNSEVHNEQITTDLEEQPVGYTTNHKLTTLAPIDGNAWHVHVCLPFHPFALQDRIWSGVETPTGSWKYRLWSMAGHKTEQRRKWINQVIKSAYSELIPSGKKS